jgi:hypothetical protein
MNQCPADPVPSAESGLPSGPQSHGQEPAGCLILRFKGQIDEKTALLAREFVAPIAQRLNLQAMVLDQDAEVEIRYSQDPIVAALHEQAAAINRLASSNESLSQAVANLIEEMANAEEQDPDAEPRTYLDGSKVR